MSSHTITREIQIDMGHRVPQHHSHCRNLHGHRYRILATVVGPLIERGSQEGMVMDFGFLKQAMMKEIHERFDHKLCLCRKDIVLYSIVNPHTINNGKSSLEETLKQTLWVPLLGTDNTAVVVIEEVPTAENLARIWFHMLEAAIADFARTEAGKVLNMTLDKLEVYETPNSMATFRRR